MADMPGPLLDERLRARLERIELVSALGVLALRIGVGVFLAGRLRGVAPEFVVAAIALHG